MDGIDRRILNLLQNGLPVCDRPYLALAGQAGVTEEELIARVARLKDDGIIRRISAFFQPAALGYRSTLCAAKVPEGDLERVAAAINAFPQVTHNYLRDNDQYNVWFTVIAEGEEGVSSTVQEIEQAAGVEVCDFSSLAFYKIKVNFDMEEGGRNEGPTG